MDAFLQYSLNQELCDSRQPYVSHEVESWGMWTLVRSCYDLWGVCGWRTTGGWDPAWGIFPLHSHAALAPFTYSRLAWFFTVFHPLCQPCVSNVAYCVALSLFVNKHASTQCLLLAATMYMAKYLHVSQAFRPSLVPTVRPLTHGSQPILSSYRMRQCRTWGG